MFLDGFPGDCAAVVSWTVLENQRTAPNRWDRPRSRTRDRPFRRGSGAPWRAVERRDESLADFPRRGL